jgi:hypothetical protein
MRHEVSLVSRKRIVATRVVRWVSLVGAIVIVVNCGRTSSDYRAPGDAGGAGGTPGSTATGGVWDSGGAGGVRNTDYVSPAGGTPGTGGANVNVRECPSAVSNPMPKNTCFACDPLPSGSTDGCPVPLNCNDVDRTSPLRYPDRCHVVFPSENSYWPGILQDAYCDNTRWACQY